MTIAIRPIRRCQNVKIDVGRCWENKLPVAYDLTETSYVSSATFADKPVLTGQNAVLRPFADGDVAAMIEILRDPEVGRLTGSPDKPLDTEVIRRWYTSRNAQADRLDLAIVDRASGEVVGETVLNQWDDANRSCNFRILIGPRGRDRGLGSEAVLLTVGYGFEQLGLHRIWLGVFAFNPRAIRVYEKAGFVVEGVDREALFADGQWIDHIRMAILEQDWLGPQRRDKR